MQTLGLSDSTPRTENRLRALLWPTIRNDVDFDYVTTQGFWICFLVAVFTIIWSAMSGSWISGLFEAGFYFLAAMGVRQQSRVAACAAFSAYLMSALVMQRYNGGGFSVITIIFLALLFANVRGSWVSAHWSASQREYTVPRLSQTLGDKLSDQLPSFVWPKLRVLFYILAAIEITLLAVALFAPRQLLP